MRALIVDARLGEKTLVQVRSHRHGLLYLDSFLLALQLAEPATHALVLVDDALAILAILDAMLWAFRLAGTAPDAQVVVMTSSCKPPSRFADS